MKPSKKTYILILTLLLLLQLFPHQVFAIDTLSPYPAYEGLQDGGALYQTIRFTDIDGHWARAAIQETAALSLMSGTGNQRFQPNQPLTHLQALTILVKALGQEEEARRLGEMQTPPTVRDIVVLSAADNWGQGYLQVALQNNIVTPQEMNQILNLTPVQMDNLQQQVSERMEAFEDGELTPAEITNLQNQIRNQLETNATWNRPISRQQMAAWIARALDLEGIYGANMVNVQRFTDMNQMDTEKIPLIEAIIQNGIMSGTSNTTFAPRQTLTRGQMAQMMTKVQEELLEERGLTKKEGEIVTTENIQHQGVTKRVLTIKNDDNSNNLIVVEASNKDFPVRKNGNLSLSNALSRGDWIRYYINEGNEVIYAAVDDVPIREIEGFVETTDIENRQLVMTDFQNRRHILEVPSSAKIQVNGRSVPLDGLLYGMEIKASVHNNRASSLQGYLEEDPDRHGYIPPGTRVKVGDVLFIDSDTVEIRSAGNRERYRINTGTRILRNERPSQLFEVKVGDRVMLFFNDIYSPDIATIRVEDHERHIDGVYRGQIEQVDQRNREIILRNVSTYQQGRWVRHPQDQVKLRAEGDLLYEGGEKITLRDLTSRRDQEVYIALENSYGVPRVAKLLMKQGSTVAYDSTITDIQFGTSRMIVDNVGFNFHPGTIVIKDNRLVDMLNLDLRQTVNIAADLLRGTRNASVISIEGTSMLDDRIDGTRLAIYRGTIQDIHQYGITLGRLAYRLDYLRLEDNRWVEMSGSRRVTLTEDTYIYDSQLELEIEASYFIDTRFIDPEDIEDDELRRRITDRFYLNKGAYFVVKETHVDGEVYEEVLALNLTPVSIHEGGRLHIEHSAIGSISEVDMDNETITLNNVRHWNSLNNRWETVPRGETINTDKAVILLNDTPVGKEELHRLRRNAQAYVVKSKNVSTGDDAYVIIVEQ
ncbi:S-layer homology domain-containing protein [Natronincola peptidivorans]|uniref:S-layer homology domain-containing protein n=1 Tax=Natronincola peptidivorans TaxID=426128 RepID=A0A1I0CSN5_9FIRM|nr:S-layer homology domain-containing protein [Natronincola peptidivorans]SET22278.1 S-layer homology domain-containing protein [Natronincola peptidivorans]